MSEEETSFWDNDHTSEEEVEHTASVSAEEAAKARYQRVQEARARREQEAAEGEDFLDGIEDDESEYSEGEDDSDYDEQSVLDNAVLRLEQAQLYKMLMESDLFADVQANPEAIKNVQRELKRFIKERLEIFLGIRAPKAEAVEYESPFSDLEIKVLKSVAHKVSGGTVGSPIVGGSLPKISAKVQQPATPLRSRSSSKPQRKPQPKYKPLSKPIHEMTEDELILRNEEIAKRQAASKAPAAGDRLAMPSMEQQEQLYQNRSTVPATVGGPNLIQAIMSAVEKNKQASTGR